MRQFPIRTRLLLLVAVILVPLTMVHVWGIHTQYEETYDRELSSSVEYAQAIRTAFVNHIQGIWAAELGIGLAAATSDMDSAALQALLQHFVPTSPTLTAAMWADSNGIVRVGDDPEVTGLDLRSRPYFVDVLSGKDRIITNAISASPGETPSVAAIRAIHSDQGDLQGLVVGSLEVSWLPRVLAIERQRPTDVFTLVDGSGVVIMRVTGQQADENPCFFQLPTDSVVMTAMREGQSAFTASPYQSSQSERAELIGAALPIPDFGWAVFVATNRVAALADARRRSMVELSITALTLLFALAIAMYVGNNLKGPLTQLEHAAQALTLGDNSARAGISGRDELAAAGARFDAMAERLQRVEHQRLRFLQSMAHELRNPLAAMRGIVQLVRLKTAQGHQDANEKLYAVLDDEVTNLSTMLVQDEGRGIPPEDVTRVFDMFYRVKNPGLADPGGTGIGLYIARETIQAHGGDIWVESNGRHGSTFCVRLPRV